MEEGPNKNIAATNIVGKQKQGVNCLPLYVAEAVVSADDCPAEKETTATLLMIYWILHNILLHKALSFNFHILYPILTQGGPAL